MAEKKARTASMRSGLALVLSPGNVYREVPMKYDDLEVLVGDADWALGGYVARINATGRRYETVREWQAGREREKNRMSSIHVMSKPAVVIRERNIEPVTLSAEEEIEPLDVVEHLLTFNAVSAHRAAQEADEDYVGGDDSKTMLLLTILGVAVVLMLGVAYIVTQATEVI